jgi:hypothetical protein
MAGMMDALCDQPSRPVSVRRCSSRCRRPPQEDERFTVIDGLEWRTVGLVIRHFGLVSPSRGGALDRHAASEERE